MKQYILFTLLVLLSNFYSISANAQNWQEETQDIFQQIDFNQDGKISPTEYFVIEDVTLGYRKHLTNVWKSLDVNNDRIVTPDEYLGKLNSSENQENITEQAYWFIELFDYPQYQRHLLHFFNHIDKNQDGFLEAEEYINTFGQSLIAEGKKYARALDINQDNKISKSEFLNFDFKMPNYEGFENIDFNHDNFISKDEMLKFFEILHYQLTNW